MENLGTAYQLRRGVAELAETEFSQYIRKELGPEGHRIASYFAPASCKFCVGVWRDKDRGLVTELLARDPRDPFTRMDAEFLRHYVSPQRPRDFASAKQKLRDRMHSQRARRTEVLQANHARDAWAIQQLNIHNQPPRIDHKE